MLIGIGSFTCDSRIWLLVEITFIEYLQYVNVLVSSYWIVCLIDTPGIKTRGNCTEFAEMISRIERMSSLWKKMVELSFFLRFWVVECVRADIYTTAGRHLTMPLPQHWSLSSPWWCWSSHFYPEVELGCWEGERPGHDMSSAGLVASLWRMKSGVTCWIHNNLCVCCYLYLTPVHISTWLSDPGLLQAHYFSGLLNSAINQAFNWLDVCYKSSGVCDWLGISKSCWSALPVWWMLIKSLVGEQNKQMLPSPNQLPHPLPKEDLFSVFCLPVSPAPHICMLSHTHTPSLAKLA